MTHIRDLELKEDDVQMIEPNLKRVSATSGTRLRLLSGILVVQTPTGSTSNASTPMVLRSLS